MTKILITESKGNIGNKIILELFKKQYNITLVTANIKNSYKKLPIPINRIEVDLSKTKILDNNIASIDMVLDLSLLERDPTKDDLVASKNLIASFGHEVSFYHLSSSRVYEKSILPINEDSPLSLEHKVLIDVEDEFLKHNATIIRPGFILSQENKEFKKLLMLSRFYIGYKFNHQDFISWIHIEDLISNLEILFEEKKNARIINLISNKVKMTDFYKSIKILTQRNLNLPILKLPSSIDLLEMTTNNKSYIKLKYPDLDIALEDALCHLKSPTTRRKMFHYEYNKVQFINRDVTTTFDFFKDARNLENITPKKLNFKITSQSTKEIQEGTRFTYKLKLNGIPFSWTTFIENWNAPFVFTDYQKKGPYQVWYHTHSFYELDGGTLMVDNVKYRLPLGFIGDLFGLAFVKKNIKDIFNYRFNIIKDLLK